jgi:hypothetical protein
MSIVEDILSVADEQFEWVQVEKDVQASFNRHGLNRHSVNLEIWLCIDLIRQRRSTTKMSITLMPIVGSGSRRCCINARAMHSTVRTASHENPLGIPRREANPAPVIPRRGAPPSKSRIRGVQRVITVASGKGGVGKSTVAGGRFSGACDCLSSY